MSYLSNLNLFKVSYFKGWKLTEGVNKNYYKQLNRKDVLIIIYFLFMRIFAIIPNV